MTEWQVVGVLITLVGAVTALVTPLLKLNTTITKLTSTLDNLKADVKIITDTVRQNKEDGHASHKRLWDHNVEQDKKIQEHDVRIEKLEEKNRPFHPASV